MTGKHGNANYTVLDTVVENDGEDIGPRHRLVYGSLSGADSRVRPNSIPVWEVLDRLEALKERYRG